VERFSQEHQDAVECYKQQRRKVSHLKKTIKSTKGFKEFQKIIDMRNFTKEKIERLEARSRRLTRRIKQIEPTGWKEFLQVTMHLLYIHNFFPCISLLTQCNFHIV
jgi:septal ring factor EnvC (AmiA/AmiB activator)